MKYSQKQPHTKKICSKAAQHFLNLSGAVARSLKRYEIYPKAATHS